MADRDPIEQADPGQPVVTAPTILNGARRNTALDPYAGSRICVSPCQCPTGWARNCTPNYDPDAEPFDDVEDCESFDFYGFDWFAVDTDSLDECAGCGDIQQRLAEITAQGAAFMLGRELDSAPLTGNASLQSESIAISTNPAHPADALTMLLHAAGLKGQYRSTFIGADYLLPTLLEAGLVAQVNGQWRLAGRPIIFSPGISGDGPGGAAADAGTAWLYLVNGSVDYNWQPVNWADIDLTGIAEDVRKNQVHAQAITSGIVRFNPLCTHAVPVCLKHESCCDPSGEAQERAVTTESIGATERAAAAETERQALVAAGTAALKRAAEADAAAEKARAEAAAVAEKLAAEQAKVAAEKVAAEKAEAARLATEAENAALRAMAGTLDEPAKESADDEAVPDGTIAEVLEWVDGDKGRAATALDAERSGKERSTLIEQLEDITNG